MNNRSRSINSSINITVTILSQVLTIIFGFVVRTVFIKTLGADYLGIGGLFSNILSLLSLADLGIGAAISFALYKPIADKDFVKLKSIMAYFKRVYQLIALIVFILGCSLIPFLKYLINLEEDIPDLTLIYLLQLLNTTVSYLCVYKSTLLVADQRVYITRIINFLGCVLADILQFVVLLIWHNIVVYLLMGLVSKLVVNFSLSYIADKYYPFLREKAEILQKEERKRLFANIKAVLVYRFVAVILNATDNILISVLISTTVVGYYSNYSMLISSVTGIAALIFDALKGTIGSLTTEPDKTKVKHTFDAISFANFWIYSVITVCLAVLLNDFISLWVGKEFLLSAGSVAAICFASYVPGVMLTIENFRDTTGVFKKTKYMHVLAAVLNIVFSIVLGRRYGMVGIILATSIARIITIVWYDPRMLFSEYFNLPVLSYYLEQCKDLVILIVMYGVAMIGLRWLHVTNYFLFIVKAFLCFVLCNGVVLLTAAQKTELKTIIGIVKSVLIPPHQK